MVQPESSPSFSFRAALAFLHGVEPVDAPLVLVVGKSLAVGHAADVLVELGTEQIVLCGERPRPTVVERVTLLASPKSHP